jgi:hypothetical protein
LSEAFRESNLTAVGASPRTEELSEALTLFNRIILSMYSSEAGEELTDLPYGEGNMDTPELVSRNFLDFDDEYIPHNTRLILNLEEPKEVSLNPLPNDGDRFAVIDTSGNLSTNTLAVEGNGRLIESSTAITLNTDSLSRAWFYRADKGNWQRVTDLVEGDEVPFPSEFDDLLIIRLAMRLNPRYGREINPQSLDRLNELLRKFRSKYKQRIEKPSELALRKLSLGTSYYGTYSIYDTNENFYKGRTW